MCGECAEHIFNDPEEIRDHVEPQDWPDNPMEVGYE